MTTAYLAEYLWCTNYIDFYCRGNYQVSPNISYYNNSGWTASGTYYLNTGDAWITYLQEPGGQQDEGYASPYKNFDYSHVTGVYRVRAISGNQTFVAQAADNF